MKTRNDAYPLLLAVLLSVAASPCAAQSETAGPVTVAFLGFVSSDIGTSGLEILSELVRHEMSIAPGWSLVETRTDTILAEQERQLSTAFDAAGAATIGKLLGARKLVAGRIGLLGNLNIITLDLVDIETGTVEKAVSEEFIGELEDLRKPVRIAAQKLLGIRGIEVNQGSFLSIATDPPGVDVFVNGLFEGSSPLVVKLPKAGKYGVKLASEGFKTWTQNVDAEEDATYFVNAKLLRQEKPVDERVKALQDGRAALLTYSTIYAAAASDMLLFTFGVDFEENIRLYVGLPLVTAPTAFFVALKLTEGTVMNSGRSFMIVSGSLWGSAWGIAAAFVFGATSGDGAAPPGPALYTGLSLTGSFLYGAAAVALTWGDNPFPASRAWLFNLGSALGALLGLGIPYVFNADSPVVVYSGMLSGSLAGSAIALYLTRDMTQGSSVGHLALGSLIEVGRDGLRAGIPLPSVAAGVGGQGVFLPIARLSY